MRCAAFLQHSSTNMLNLLKKGVAGEKGIKNGR
jgi:hypothetical protein